MCKWDWMYCSLTSLQSSVWSLCVVQQDETTQRHEEYLRQIREKAFEMSILRHSTEDHNDAPEPTPYDKNKLCIICNVLVSFSLSVFHPHLATETSCALSATFWLVFPWAFFTHTLQQKQAVHYLQCWLVFPHEFFLPTPYDDKLCIICNVLVCFSSWVFSPHTLWWKQTVYLSWVFSPHTLRQKQAVHHL